MRHNEDDIQMACVRWFRLQYPDYLLHHSPNGGKRNAREAGRFKQMGTVAGFPDLFIAVARGRHHGMFVEMKSGKNKPTQAQTNVMAALLLQGYKCEICYSVEEFITIVNDYLG